MKTVLWGKYGRETWEEIDSVERGTKNLVEIQKEKNFLLNEYRLAYGAGWSFVWRRVKKN